VFEEHRECEQWPHRQWVCTGDNVGCNKQVCSVHQRKQIAAFQFRENRNNKISIMNLVTNIHQQQQVEVYITHPTGKMIQATQRLKAPTVSRWYIPFTM